MLISLFIYTHIQSLSNEDIYSLFAARWDWYFWNMFQSFYPPLSGCSIRVRDPMDALRHRCTFYMSYSIYNTDICLYSDAPKHLAVSYHLPPPFFLLRDSNHESCQREKHSYLHILHPYSYSIITAASFTFALMHLEIFQRIGRWKAGWSCKYPPPILLIFLFLSIIYYLYLQMWWYL